MRDVLRVARKEFRVFFATPAAYLFLGAFLAATLFVVFWLETFFARNIADVRPVFQWLPVLLIFLVAALTMRAWSEERRAGTLESLLTAPVAPLSLVLGKFVAALALVALALALTLPLPVTVSLLGPLDWGPVVGGYVATLFLAAAYASIGLYMSARTDNPIVALILTALACGVFYLVGSDTLTGLFGQPVAGVLAALGTGSRFESITRGVLDLRDLYYYVSIVGVFLALNLFALERLRWAGNPASRRHRLWGWTVTLAAANFVAANLWLAPVTWARADITQEKAYSLSEATERQLDALREPLLIRGYFSAKTHPLLAPLVPQLRDLIEEYAVAADGRARVEFVDPQRDPEAEEEAASRYGIRPVPFQTASRYQASVVNSYFDVVVSYGDQYEVLGYGDLIEVKMRGEGDLDVVLKNPEYALTRAIRKVVDAYQAGGNPFDMIPGAVSFRGYMSPDDILPTPLVELRRDLVDLLEDLREKSGGKLEVEFADPEAGDGALAAQLTERYGFGPMVASLLDPQPFWYYMVFEGEGGTVQVPLPEGFDKDSLERALDSALQRLAPGFLRTLAVVRPPALGPGSPRYDQLSAALAEGARLVDTDLSGGRVPEAADLLLVLAPRELDDRQRFAIDQFLMRGGSVVLATSPFDVALTGSLAASKVDSGLADWLAHLGITIGEAMVLDPRNAALPIPVERNVGGMTFREIQMMPYALFPDLRGDGLSRESPVTASLDQLTLNWASPIEVDAGKNQGRTVARLLESSAGSWTSDSLDIVPDFAVDPELGFAASADRGRKLLAVAIEGRFDSFYQGKEPPPAAPPEGAGEDDAGHVPRGVIDRSPESARLVVIASNTFGSDIALDLASQGLNTLYTQPIEFLQNAIDWSLEDPGLLSLRGRTQLARTLEPLDEGRQRFWEYLNYGLALGGLVLVWAWRRRVAAGDRLRYQRILAEA